MQFRKEQIVRIRACRIYNINIDFVPYSIHSLSPAGQKSVSFCFNFLSSDLIFN